MKRIAIVWWLVVCGGCSVATLGFPDGRTIPSCFAAAQASTADILATGAAMTVMAVLPKETRNIREELRAALVVATFTFVAFSAAMGLIHSSECR